MLMATGKEEEAVRLYSRGYRNRTPVDEILPQHREVHAHLIRWGMWAGARGRNRSLASIEGLYTKAGTPASTAPLSADPQIMDMERAVIRLPAAHMLTVRLLYVNRFAPVSICQRARMRYEAWPDHIATCRAMVVNLLRRHGVGKSSA
jgi:hypothetical protein